MRRSSALPIYCPTTYWISHCQSLFIHFFHNRLFLFCGCDSLPHLLWLLKFYFLYYFVSLGVSFFIYTPISDANFSTFETELQLIVCLACSWYTIILSALHFINLSWGRYRGFAVRGEGQEIPWGGDIPTAHFLFSFLTVGWLLHNTVLVSAYTSMTQPWVCVRPLPLSLPTCPL